MVAAAAGASAVCNVDVSGSCLADGVKNALLNDVQMETLKYDAIIAMRMFAGLPVKPDRRTRGNELRGRASSDRRPRKQSPGVKS